MKACLEIRISDEVGNPGLIRVPCELTMPVMHSIRTNDGYILNCKAIKSMTVKI